jgi:hypothetical protein
MQVADPTVSSYDFQQFRLSIHLMTADHQHTCLTVRFPSVAWAILNFVIANPTKISQRLLQCGVIFTGSASAIRRVNLSNLLGIDGSQLKRLSKTPQ